MPRLLLLSAADLPSLLCSAFDAKPVGPWLLFSVHEFTPLAAFCALQQLTHILPAQPNNRNHFALVSLLLALQNLLPIVCTYDQCFGLS